MYEKLKYLTQNDFNLLKQGVYVKISEPDSTQDETFHRLWLEIKNHTYMFDRQSVELTLLKSITINEFIDYFFKMFLA